MGVSSSDTRKPYAGTTKGLVLAFDVGTTYSGVSYSILEPSEVPKIHGVTRFPGQEHVAGNSKIPSVMYYDRHGKMRAAGAEVESSSIVAQAEDEDWLKVELFKLRLRPRTMQLDMNGMSLGPLPHRNTAVEVFGDFLRYLFQCTRDFIINTHANGSRLWRAVAGQIQFVCSHPNGWQGFQQTQMRRSAIYGELIPNTNEGKARIRFVTEGEASLHACVLNGLAADVLSDPKRHGFIVADAGGGTLDISSYAIKSTSPLIIEEIAPPDCIFAGSVFVSRRAREFLEEKLKNSKYGNPEALDHITKRFDETTKRLFRSRKDLQFIPFGSPFDKDSTVGIRNGQLKLTGVEVAALFEPSVDAAVTAIKGQIDASGGLVKSVWLVGGFAASPWLFSQLQERLRGVTVNRPDSQTSKAVADGAIGFYFDHFVHARMSKAFYGVEYLREFDENDVEHIERKGRLCELPSGPKLLPDAFDCILARSVKVKESTVFTRKYVTELTSLSTLSEFQVEIWCYRGSVDAVPKWILRQSPDFSTLCAVKADLSLLTGSAQPKSGPNGTYWTIVFSIEIHFGLTEFTARIKWVDNGQTKYGPASIVYNESGYRADEIETASTADEDTAGTLHSASDKHRHRHHHSKSASTSRTASSRPSSSASSSSILETPKSDYTVPDVVRVDQTPRSSVANASSHSRASSEHGTDRRGRRTETKSRVDPMDIATVRNGTTLSPAALARSLASVLAEREQQQSIEADRQDNELPSVTPSGEPMKRMDSTDSDTNPGVESIVNPAPDPVIVSASVEPSVVEHARTSTDPATSVRSAVRNPVELPPTPIARQSSIQQTPASKIALPPPSLSTGAVVDTSPVVAQEPAAVVTGDEDILAPIESTSSALFSESLSVVTAGAAVAELPSPSGTLADLVNLGGGNVSKVPTPRVTPKTLTPMLKSTMLPTPTPELSIPLPPSTAPSARGSRFPTPRATPLDLALVTALPTSSMPSPSPASPPVDPQVAKLVASSRAPSRKPSPLVQSSELPAASTPHPAADRLLTPKPPSSTKMPLTSPLLPSATPKSQPEKSPSSSPRTEVTSATSTSLPEVTDKSLTPKPPSSTKLSSTSPLVPSATPQPRLDKSPASSPKTDVTSVTTASLSEITDKSLTPKPPSSTKLPSAPAPLPSVTTSADVGDVSSVQPAVSEPPAENSKTRRKRTKLAKSRPRSGHIVHVDTDAATSPVVPGAFDGFTDSTNNLWVGGELKLDEGWTKAMQDLQVIEDENKKNAGSSSQAS